MEETRLVVICRGLPVPPPHLITHFSVPTYRPTKKQNAPHTIVQIWKITENSIIRHPIGEILGISIQRVSLQEGIAWIGVIRADLDPLAFPMRRLPIAYDAPLDVAHGPSSSRAVFRQIPQRDLPR